MALRFPYIHFPMNRPVFPLRGRWVRPRPVVGVTLIGPGGSKAKEALLDSGADDTLFPEQVAADLGIDLIGTTPVMGSGIGGSVVLLRYAEVKLRLTDGREYREWSATVGFTSSPLRLPVLGFAGCLQFFTATFRGDLEQVDLEVNRLYPGT